jgi:hypothetical protein
LKKWPDWVGGLHVVKDSFFHILLWNVKEFSHGRQRVELSSWKNIHAAFYSVYVYKCAQTEYFRMADQNLTAFNLIPIISKELYNN